MPAVLAAALAARPGRSPASGSRSRPATGCGSRARSGGPPTATGRARRAAGCRRSSIPHGGPTWQAYRAWVPFKQLLVARGLRLPRRRLPRLDRLRPRLPRGEHRRVGPRRRVTTWSTRPAGPPTSRGATAGSAIYGGSYGGYLVLCALVEEPGAVAGRRRPVRRLGDRRELPPRRPARPARPRAPDGRARRSGARPRSSGAARRSTGPSGSRRRCSSSTAARTSASSR